MFNVPVTIGSILANLDDLLLVSESPKLDAEILLSHVLGRNRAYLYAHSDQLLSDSQRKAYAELFSQRMTGEPVAYLTGHQGFWHLDLTVDHRVLVPRPETELLIEMALEIDCKQVTSAVDLGTGSGAIAIALACERPSWEISATDLSADALSIARLNAQQIGVHIDFYQGDWFAALPLRRFDMVISNPPYIDPADPHLLSQTLKHEPTNALVSRERGLADLQHIIAGAKQYLSSNGWIILEHGYDQSAEVCAMLGDYGYTSIHSRKDLAGNDRAAIAQATSRL